MEEMVKTEVARLVRECQSYDDALGYVDEVVSDVYAKYPREDCDNVRQLTLLELWEAFQRETES